ncbi:MAG: 4Fe-4S dicluster domain-containing protein [Desulfobacteraceae bacterium]|nr:4Fe-4S dicluster domain-containing protein [Desulfobacteraceae bacterium]MDH3574084.1 4Fe-4S dicluster domain-containing protein [Desulfobacteraceae bacterium]MDH3721483.1 4Fe-4S dicluster domain-containing protein [Desulfobacteraceae bacterium]MDH3836910.1 4Fe-4S dicluster domain-containing protein [Desulfobacteraceae bacterium]MDH3874145.1 4Fe-4S dicluster domain-containing protein [Desulfobacteraceae bacterium]
MTSIRIRKGYDINIAGTPSCDVEKLEKPTRVALLPERIPFIKPRLKVKVDDQVNVGSPIFEDKQNPDFIFLSPGGGRITKIDYGPRRIIKEIIIALDQDEGHEIFPMINEAQLEDIEREALVQMLTAGGLWPLFRELPFRNIPNPQSFPPSIIISLGSKEPFQPVPEVYLKDKVDLFEFGIKILNKLTRTLFISASPDNNFVPDRLNTHVTHTCEGVYPADDPGVLLYTIKKHPDENRAWYINGQDVILLAMLFKTGKYPVDRTVVLGGILAREKKHLQTRMGVPLNHITKGHADDTGAARHIVGGIFNGYTGSKDSYMGFYETSLVLIPEGDEKEFFGFARPGFNKPSRSRAFLSVFNPSAMPMECNQHGENRACVNCGFCAEVCPVDILPQFTYKSILADEIEEALDHGLLDCVECGLCTYVCPSKVKLSVVLKNTKKAYYLEQL